MAFVLRPSRFISINSCKSFPLSNRGPPPSQDRPVHTLVWGWGIFNRLYGDFCTGADSTQDLRRMVRCYGTGKPGVGVVSRFYGRERVEDAALRDYLLGLRVSSGRPMAGAVRVNVG